MFFSIIIATFNSEKYINQTINLFKEEGIGTLASVCGRFYAMDRDKNYERTKIFYDLLTPLLMPCVLALKLPTFHLEL